MKYASGKELDTTPVVIHSDRNLECSETFKIGFEKETEGPSELIANEYLDLFARITSGDLTKEELRRFEENKERVRLYKKIMQTENAMEALQMTEEAINKYPDDSYFYCLKALKCLTLEREDEGIAAIDKAIELFPVPYYQLVKTAFLYNKGEWEEAYKILLPIRDILPGAFYQYCLIKAALGRFPKEEVLKELDELKAMNYFPAKVNNLIASYKNKIGDYKNAEQAIYEAIELDKEEGDFYATLAEIKANQGDYPQFYMNMDIALSKGISLDIIMKQFSEIYSRFKNDEKFLSILRRYNKDEEIELLKTL